MKNYYFVEITDTYGGESNYSWVRRYLVNAKSERGAVQKIACEYGAGWRRVYSHSDNGGRYDLRGAAVCMFVDFVPEEEVDEIRGRYLSIIEL